MITFTPANWYWIVGGSSTQVYSSAAGDYAATTDSTYQAWLGQGNKPTNIDTETNLGAVLAPYHQRPINANVLAAYQLAAASAVDIVLGKVLFNHENRIRTLAGQQQVTAQQFVTAVAALL